MFPAVKISAGMIPTLALPGRERARAVRADQRHAHGRDVRVDPQHVVGRDAFGDRDHGVDAGVDRLVDRVGRERRRHEDHRRVRAVLRDRLGDGVEHGHALDVLAALAGRHARDEVRAVGAVAEAVEAPLGAGQALDDEPRVVVDDDRHQAGYRLERDLVEREPAVADPIAEQLRDTRRVVALAAAAVEPRLQLDRLLEEPHLVDLEPGRLDEGAPLGLAVVAHVRRVAELLGLLDVVAHEQRCRR